MQPDNAVIQKLRVSKRWLAILGLLAITAINLHDQVNSAQGAAPLPRQAPATAQQSPPPVQPPAHAENFAANQVLHILVGHSVVIRTEARLRRVLVGNPAVVTTATTAPNELVVTATAPGSSSVILWQENNQSRIIEVFADVDVSLLREAISRGLPGEAVEA